MNKKIDLFWINKISYKLKNIWSDRTFGERLYLIAFSVFLAADSLSTTMFPFPGKVYLLLRLLGLFLVVLKIAFYDQMSVKFFSCLILGILIGGGIWFFSGYSEPLFWIIMLFGARGVSLRKMIKSYFFISVCVVFCAFSASMLGIIENLQYARENPAQVRNSFGIIYTTDFAAHIFGIFLALFYLLRERLRWWYYVIVIIAAGLTYHFCYTRLDVACILGMVFLFLFINVWNRRKSPEQKYRRNFKVYKIVLGILLFLIAGMFVLSLCYQSDSSLWTKIDEIMSSRLMYGKQGLMQYGMSLFGQQIEMVGNGGGELQLKEYFFVDCSYLYIFLRYGICFFVIVLAVIWKCCKKYNSDIYYLAVILLASINCIIAHHIIELAYNPFYLALFASIAEGSGLGTMRVKWKGRYAGADRWHEKDRL